MAPGLQQILVTMSIYSTSNDLMLQSEFMHYFKLDRTAIVLNSTNELLLYIYKSFQSLTTSQIQIELLKSLSKYVQ